MKRITITLDEVGEKMFNELAYSLDLPKGSATHSDIINHVLGEIAAFEQIMDDQITNWLVDHCKEDYEQWIKDNNIKQYKNSEL